MRINKYIAKSGYTSRRKADDLIKASKVKVNGIVINEPGYEVTDDDILEIDGKRLYLEKNFYKKLYKPVGYVTSNYDPHNEKDLNSLIDMKERFFAAGRLDKDSEGLLIITNDGNFTNGIIHPRNELEKTYIVTVSRKLSKSQEKKFEKGIDIGRGEITSNSKIKLLDSKINKYEVKIHQGYNRQIRRMFDYFSSEVIRLKRISIGAIKLDDMKEYEIRDFSEEEMEFVRIIKG